MLNPTSSPPAIHFGVIFGTGMVCEPGREAAKKLHSADSLWSSSWQQRFFLFLHSEEGHAGGTGVGIYFSMSVCYDFACTHSTRKTSASFNRERHESYAIYQGCRSRLTYNCETYLSCSKDSFLVHTSFTHCGFQHFFFSLRTKIYSN